MLPAEGSVADRVTLYENQQEIARKRAMLAAAPQYTAAPTVAQVLQGASMPPPPYTPAPYAPPQPAGGSFLDRFGGGVRDVLGGTGSLIRNIGSFDLPEGLKAQPVYEHVEQAIRDVNAGNQYLLGQTYVGEGGESFPARLRKVAFPTRQTIEEERAAYEQQVSPINRMAGEALVHPLTYGLGAEAFTELLNPEFGAVSRGARAVQGAGQRAQQATATYEAAKVGNKYVAPLPDFAATVESVRATENPIVRGVVGRTGINPSTLATDPVDRGLIGHFRQRLMGDELANVSVTGSLDRFAQPVTGREVFDVNAVGEITNLRAKAGQSIAWNDVFSHPADYTLSAVQRDYIRTYQQVVVETEAQRVAAGLKPRPTLVDEGVYVPRQVQTIRGIELRKPSRPEFERVYEEAQEGIANGVQYDNPRSTLLLHVRTAYREIAADELSQYMEAFSITPKQLIPADVVQRMADANLKKLSAQAELRGLQRQRLRTQVGGTYKGTERVAQETLIAARRSQRAAVGTAIVDARVKVASATKDYNIARGAYTKRLAEARNAEVAKGTLFGMSEADEIPIRLWRNRFFPREQAEKLGENLGTYFQTPQAGNVLSRAFELTGNEIRLSAASGDLAMPFIHGLPLLGRNPVAWARMTLTHYTVGWADPTVYGRFASNHLVTLQEMAQHGVPVGDIEFLTAAKPGGGMAVLKPLEAIPGGQTARAGVRAIGRQTIGRLQADFAGGLMQARTYLWESIKPGWSGTLDELGAYVRNMTGGLETKALGVGPAQRGFESFWGAFSPKLLRSTVALGYDAMRFFVNPTDPRARESARSVAQLLAGMYGAYFLTGKAMGRSNDEILTGMNPLSGKKYLSYKIGNDWIGVGGQARALIQLFAKGVTNPKSLLDMSLRDNPLIAAYFARAAPGLTLGQSVTSAVTGGKVNLGGYNEPTSMLSLLGHIPISALPFVAQGVIEGQGPLANFANLIGWRTSVSTPTEKKDEAFSNFVSPETGKPTGMTYNEGTKADKDAFDAANPEFKEAQQLRTEAEYNRMDKATIVSKLMTDAKKDFDAALAIVPSLPSGIAQKEAYQQAHDDYQAQLSRIRRSNPDVFAEWEKEPPKTDREKVYRNYTDLFGKYEDPNTGQVPAEKKDVMFTELDTYMAGLNDTQAAQLLADMGGRDTPWLKQYRADTRTFIPYWHVADQVWVEMQKALPELGNYATFDDFQEVLIQEAVKQGIPRELVLAMGVLDKIPYVSTYHSVTNDVRNAMVQAQPQLGAIGLKYGWIPSVRKATLPGVADTMFATPTP